MRNSVKMVILTLIAVGAVAIYLFHRIKRKL